MTRPRVWLTLEWRCHCGKAFHGTTLRHGQVWVRCPDDRAKASRDPRQPQRRPCQARYLATALLPGATGQALVDQVGPVLALQAIRAYLPIAGDLELAECVKLPLVALSSPGPAYCLIGPVGKETQAQYEYAPVARLVRGLGLDVPDRQEAA